MPSRTRREPPPTLVLLVRHGLTPTTGKVLPGRAAGLHLSEEGRLQAQRLAARLAELERIEAVYASPMERARETAAPVARAVALRVRSEKGLDECDFGKWTGRELEELKRLPEWQEMQSRPSRFRFPGGESIAQMALRVTSTLDRLAELHRGEVIVAVTHADPIRAALCDAVGSHLDALNRLVIAPCSVSALLLGSGSARVLATNNTGDDLTALATG